MPPRRIYSHRKLLLLLAQFLCCVLAFAASPRVLAENDPSFLAGDVIAFVGGGDVAAAQQSGHLETMLLVNHGERRLRCRNLGWEGDTVHEQPRDVGFPSLKMQLQRVKPSLIVLQYGRTEALSGMSAVTEFIRAYRTLIAECRRQTPRLLLATPPPFEKADELLPDLSVRNRDLAAFASAIADLGRELRIPVADVFVELQSKSEAGPELTDNGLQLTTAGHGRVACAFARQLGLPKCRDDSALARTTGAWKDPALEGVRLAVIAKNQLWFDYYRPQNWAFLGGDRTDQPSSRAHGDPKVRWFPREMEQFPPLIEAKELEIDRLLQRFR